MEQRKEKTNDFHIFNTLANFSSSIKFCPIIAQFISEIVAFINNQDIEFNPTKTELLFGYKNVQTYSIKNFIPLVLKKYIWRSKFKTATVTLVGFKAQLKSYLIDLKYMFDFKNVSNLFDEWNTLFEAL